MVSRIGVRAGLPEAQDISGETLGQAMAAPTPLLHVCGRLEWQDACAGAESGKIQPGLTLDQSEEVKILLHSEAPLLRMNTRFSLGTATIKASAIWSPLSCPASPPPAVLPTPGSARPSMAAASCRITNGCNAQDFDRAFQESCRQQLVGNGAGFSAGRSADQTGHALCVTASPCIMPALRINYMWACTSSYPGPEDHQLDGAEHAPTWRRQGGRLPPIAACNCGTYSAQLKLLPDHHRRAHSRWRRVSAADHTTHSASTPARSKIRCRSVSWEPRPLGPWHKYDGRVGGNGCGWLSSPAWASAARRRRRAAAAAAAKRWVWFVSCDTDLFRCHHGRHSCPLSPGGSAPSASTSLCRRAWPQLRRPHCAHQSTARPPHLSLLPCSSPGLLATWRRRRASRGAAREQPPKPTAGWRCPASTRRPPSSASPSSP